MYRPADSTHFHTPSSDPFLSMGCHGPECYLQYESTSSGSSLTLRYLTVEVLLSVNFDMDFNEGESPDRFGVRVRG